MITSLEVIQALAKKLKKISPNRAVFLNDVERMESDTTSIEVISIYDSVSGDGVVQRRLSLDIVCFFKEPTTTKALALADDLTGGLGVSISVADREIAVDYTSETRIVDDVLHYLLNISYVDRLDIRAYSADEVLLKKIEQNTGEELVLVDITDLDFKLKEMER